MEKTISIKGHKFVIDKKNRMLRDVKNPKYNINVDDLLDHPITLGLYPENKRDRQTIAKLEKIFDG